MSKEGSPSSHGHGSVAALAFGAIGVVYGDIGTSPLYALKECLMPPHGTEATRENILGVLSLMVWSLTLVVTIKYVSFITRADNRGEGGILALLALLPGSLKSVPGARIGGAALLVIAGAALLYGDGIITPAISVLSAVEGLEVAAPATKKAVVPVTCLILIALFAIQKRGTAGIGKMFGPVMLVWFVTLAGLGTWHITKNPEVLHALSPVWGVKFFAHHGAHGFFILGSVVLCVTGGEALYADMGHFGPRPIRAAWLVVVKPALVLAYLGQGALLLKSPHLKDQPFFSMVPQGIATYLLVGLATLATIIASQALITGAFSLTHQAVQLGLFPRVSVRHTSRTAEGQIYVPEINWGLAAACVSLVLALQQSSRLAAAYGIAVSGTMGITSVVFYRVTRERWGWPMWQALPLLVLFLVVDLAFFGANLVKFFDGGYIPIVVGIGFMIVMITWKVGRSILGEYIRDRSPPLDTFLAELDGRLATRVPGTAIFMASLANGVPPVVVHHVARIRVLHENVVFVTAQVGHTPHVSEKKRTTVEDLGKGFFRVIVRFGFMEQPNIPRALKKAKDRFDLPFDLTDATYYLGRETFLATAKGNMGAISEGLFSFLSRNAKSASTHFNIPPEQVVELGTQIDL